MKIAILHEMLIKLGGAEKVVESIQRLYPQADLYTLIYDEKKVGNIFPKTTIHPSCQKLGTQGLYNLTKKQRLCLPFMSRAVESLDFGEYDLVIVSSSGFAHGLITKPETKTIIYYHAPARYLWDWTHEQSRDIGLNAGIRGFFFQRFLSKCRIWDFAASQRNDLLLANSTTTRARVTKYFRRNSGVLYPPIETERFKSSQNSLLPGENELQQYYIIISTLTEFKRIDIAVKAFTEMSDIHLKIIGDGEHRSELEKISGDNIEFIGAQYGEDLVKFVQGSLGLIFPGEEDFGIVPIEVMAAGKPVFALQKGGLTETVIAGKTGEFFTDPEGGDFIKKFTLFHQNNLKQKYKAQDCIYQAEQFSEKIFHEKLVEYIERIGKT